MIYLSIFILINLNQYINAHSWISCTNYQVNKNQPINYDINKCMGFPRDFQSQYNSDLSKGFGYNTGYEFRSQNCKNPKNINYNLKIAKYFAGQEVCLIYPANNHVAEYCNNNLYIPDNGFTISRSSQNNLDIFDINYNHKNGIHTVGTVDYKGFQNCPGFCQNQEKTPCYVCFDLENNIPSGIYSFKWTWQFNPGEYYTTCWDAEITSIPSPNPITSIPSPNPITSIPSPNPITSIPSPNPITSIPSPNPIPSIPSPNSIPSIPSMNPITNYNSINYDDLIKNNPFKSMEEQCKSDDNICKDFINKKRDAYNKFYANINTNTNMNTNANVNTNINTNINTNTNMNTNTNVNTNINTNTNTNTNMNTALINYKYLSDNICK